MHLRRLCGFLTALFMLHISFVASDAACARHMAGAAMHGSADMNTEMANMGTRAQHQQPCETPVQVNCCQALASCGLSFVSSAARVEAPVLVRDAFSRGAIGAPVSLLVAPDTPPPKA